MKTEDMTADQIRACALRCPIKLNKRTGTVLASTGDYYAMPAKSEAMKPYWKSAKKDLRDREIRGGSYKGDKGHVVIGGRRFTLFPKSEMLVRDDFALWCDAHANECLTDDGGERIATETPENQRIDVVDTMLHQWKDIRKRASEVKYTGLVDPSAWNPVYDMREALNNCILELERDGKTGKCHAVSKIHADTLAALIAYRERHMKDAVNFFLDLASSAIAAAKWIQDEHNGDGSK